MSSEALSLRWRARAMFAAAAIPPLVHAIPLNRLSRWLSRPGRRDDGLNDEHLAGWVDRVLLRAPFLWHYTCLKRGAVLFLLLRRAGRAVRLHIGVRKDEQTLRARKLEQLGYVSMLDPARLEPDYLAAEIVRCLNLAAPAPSVELDLQGAPRTAELLTALLAGEIGDQ